MNIRLSHVAAAVLGAAAALTGAATFALASPSTACGTGPVSTRIACLQSEISGPGPQNLQARDTVRNWCVWLIHSPDISLGSDPVSLLLQKWKLSCGAFQH